jgi:hypothetical protein
LTSSASEPLPSKACNAKRFAYPHMSLSISLIA